MPPPLIRHAIVAIADITPYAAFHDMMFDVLPLMHADSCFFYAARRHAATRSTQDAMLSSEVRCGVKVDSIKRKGGGAVRGEVCRYTV